MPTTAPAPIPAETTTPPPASSGTRPWKWSREQYYKLGDLGFFAGKRVELLYGEIVEMSPINWPHALGVGLVSDALALVFSVGHYPSVQQPFSVPGVQLGSEPQPDVAIIPGSRRDYTGHPDRSAVLVEVADSTLFQDTTTKAQLYAEAGVADYWVLDLTNRVLLVFRDPAPLPAGLGASAYRTHLTFGPNETITPLAMPQAAIKVADLLP